MKTTVFNSVVAFLFIMVVSSFSMNVNAQEKLYSNEEEVNGLITTKTIFRNDGSLHYHLKYEYKYDDQNRMTEKTRFTWDSSRKDWQPNSKYTYTYGFQTIIMDFAKWDKRNEDYTSIKTRNIYEMNSTNTPIALISYKWNYKKNEWSLINNIRYENIKPLYAIDK